MNLTIPFRLPGFNEYSDAERTNRHAAATMKKQTQEQIGWYIVQQLKGVTFNNPVWLKYTWVEANRKRDKDNISSAQKFIQDALVKQGVIKNDGWRGVEGFEHHFEIGEAAKVQIEITEAI